MHLGVSAGPLPGFSDSLHHYNHVLTFAKILGVFNSRPVTTLQASFGNSLILSLGARACECAVLSGCAIPGILVVAGPPHSEALPPIKTVRRLYRERMQVEQSFRDFKTHFRATRSAPEGGHRGPHRSPLAGLYHGLLQFCGRARSQGSRDSWSPSSSRELSNPECVVPIHSRPLLEKTGGGQGFPSSRLPVRGRPYDFRRRGLSRWGRSFGRRLSGVLVFGEYLRLRMDRVKANGVSTTYRQSHGIGEVAWCNKLRGCATRCVVAWGST